jgi:uncharacterized repeat protein (TIGR03803 family)
MLVIPRNDINRSSGGQSGFGAIALQLAVAAAITAGTASPVLAKDYEFNVLHNFTGKNDIWESLRTDKTGNFYDTAALGGAYGRGVIYKVGADGTYTVLYNFTGNADGAFPDGSIYVDKVGNIFGTAEQGGRHGQGVVFMLSTNGTFTVLHDFKGGKDGSQPWGGLILGKGGDLFGATSAGGSAGSYGTIYKIGHYGEYKQIYAFQNYSDGAYPETALTTDNQGNLYGVTSEGGQGVGVVFKLTLDGVETVLHTFTYYGTDGGGPQGPLLVDKNGTIYGTSSEGDGTSGTDEGAVFMISTDGTFTVLHDFTGGSGTGDGQGPAGSLVLDKAGNLWGTTQWGGTTGRYGAGAIYEVQLSQAGARENVVYSLNSGSDGSGPRGLTGDRPLGTDYLFGITGGGGSGGDGTLFSIKR